MQKNVDSELFELLFLYSKSMKEKMVCFKDAPNLTIPQYMALSFIERSKSVQMKKIANYFSIEMSTATSLLEKLARQSLIRRIVGAKDRRIVDIVLSKKGEALLVKAREIQEARIKKMLSYLSEEQKRSMINILETLIQKT